VTRQDGRREPTQHARLRPARRAFYPEVMRSATAMRLSEPTPRPPA